MPNNDLTRILAVDDEPDVAKLIARTLNHGGFQAEFVTSANEALEWLETNACDIVISDIQMPEVRGTELLRILAESYPKIAVIMVTASNDVSTAVQCLNDGAYDYVVKPFDISDLIARVRKAEQRRIVAIEHRAYQDDMQARVSEQAIRIRTMMLDSLQSLNNALEAKDSGTADHSLRVKTLSMRIAHDLLPGDTQFFENLVIAAEFHDIGKIGISGDILRAPRALTSVERKDIQRHSALAERILKPLLSTDPDVLAMIRHHHERWDGTGYPDGLAGDKIPLGSRIIAVADSFDAMVNMRPYRQPLPLGKAINIIRDGTGSQWDPAVVDAFLRLVAEDGKRSKAS